jgi:hypothetical protein
MDWSLLMDAVFAAGAAFAGGFVLYGAWLASEAAFLTLKLENSGSLVSGLRSA